MEEYYGIGNSEWADPQVWEEILLQAALHFEEPELDEGEVRGKRVRSIKRRHPNLAAGFLGESAIRSTKQVAAGKGDCWNVKTVILLYRQLVINVPPPIASVAVMKLTGDYTSKDIQPLKDEKMYDVGRAQGGAVQNTTVNQVFKFSARTTILQEDIWALGSLIPLITEIHETGGTPEDATLAGKDCLPKAGVVDGYRYGGLIPVGFEIFVSSKQEQTSVSS